MRPKNCVGMTCFFFLRRRRQQRRLICVDLTSENENSHQRHLRNNRGRRFPFLSTGQQQASLREVYPPPCLVVQPRHLPSHRIQSNHLGGNLLRYAHTIVLLFIFWHVIQIVCISTILVTTLSSFPYWLIFFCCFSYYNFSFVSFAQKIYTVAPRVLVDEYFIHSQIL